MKLDNKNLLELANRQSKVIECNVQERIINVLNLLSVNNIQSIPLYTDNKCVISGSLEFVRAGNGKEYIAIISILDIAHYLLKNGMKESLLMNPIYSAVGGTSEGKSLWVAPDGISIIDSFEIFSKGVHRILVYNSFGEIRIISQSDIIRFIHDNLEDLVGEEKVHWDLEDFGLGSEQISHETSKNHIAKITSLSNHSSSLMITRIFTIWDSTLLFEALSVLHQHDLTVLPVVDPLEDKVLGNFSVSDLRGAANVVLALRNPAVGDFLREINGLEKTDQLPEPRICTLKTTLVDVMRSMLGMEFDEFPVHHIWICDNRGSPFLSTPKQLIGCISMSDIIKTVWKLIH
jgi:CBS domain-containing protein